MFAVHCKLGVARVALRGLGAVLGVGAARVGGALRLAGALAGALLV